MFDSAEFPADQRVDAWREAVESALVTADVRVLDPAVFTARLHVTSLGIAQIAASSYASLAARRTARMIRKSDPECYQLVLVESGRQRIRQLDRCEHLRPGELVLYDSSTSSEVFVGDQPTLAGAVVLQFPKRLLPIPEARVARLVAVPLPAATGVGDLFAGFLRGLAVGRHDRTERDTLRLGHIAVDLASAVLAHHLDDATAPPHSPGHVLYLNVASFIDRNLHRVDLVPATIAAAHGISVRYLHRIFQQHHETAVAAHVRARRLDHCRRDLADPGLRHLTIAAIATRWGFGRPSDFGRAFRNDVGMSPGDYRAWAGVHGKRSTGRGTGVNRPTDRSTSGVRTPGGVSR
ncbi:helix-turn-helix domain-containing protein [Saccharothrix violaceirubra]|uniref:AraC-like DNA-binding protein n=1 Tax=Saccharothrix violaceirubra TaxID=413306 RepID=A0A7W7T6E3_9PSEU|nr:helix-turn-helix domain-containing protein [Saccharothrix violaceirubra]MBB4966075.1 AraC-like DNA-binding protein [Saccharothrix violaceirubra]